MQMWKRSFDLKPISKSKVICLLVKLCPFFTIMVLWNCKTRVRLTIIQDCGFKILSIAIVKGLLCHHYCLFKLHLDNECHDQDGSYLNMNLVIYHGIVMMGFHH